MTDRQLAVLLDEMTLNLMTVREGIRMKLPEECRTETPPFIPIPDATPVPHWPILDDLDAYLQRLSEHATRLDGGT